MEYSTLFNVTSFGAVPDGKEKASQAFRLAFEACEKAGGGTIYVPAGKFLTGPIRLSNNMNLFLDAGAELIFSNDPDDYELVTSRWEGVKRQVYISCVYAENAENVSVSGLGTLNGAGGFWWSTYKEGKLNYPRPKLISFDHCSHVSIRGIKLINSPSWTVNPICCDDVTVNGISIKNPSDSPNTDGIDPDSCSNVHIVGCNIDVGDDCIAIKAGTEGTAERVPTQNVTVSDCTMAHGHGGVVLGSEMSGDITNVVITNCVFDHTDRGIRMKSRRGRGGRIQDIRISNIVMQDVICPFTANLYYFCGPGGKDKYVWDKAAYPVSEKTPAIRRIHFSDITARGSKAAAGFFYGLPEMPIEDVSMNHINIEMAAETEPAKAEMLANIEATKQKGFYCNNVRDFTFNHVTVTGTDGPAFLLENTENIRFESSAAPDDIKETNTNKTKIV